MFGMTREVLRLGLALAVTTAGWGCGLAGPRDDPAGDGDDAGNAAGAGSSGNAVGGAGASDGGGGAGSAATCEDKVCGSNHATHEFCGPPCAKGQGCSEQGGCGAWPPHIDAFYDGMEGWQLPPCDHGDDPGGDLDSAASYPWVKTMTTTATDCPQLVQDLHPMAKLGTVATEDTSVPVYGSCVSYSDGQWGTAFDGVVLWGASWQSSLGSIVYTINWRALIDHNLKPARGIGIAHLTSQGSNLCSIEMEVLYEKCPDDRDDCGSHPAPF